MKSMKALAGDYQSLTVEVLQEMTARRAQAEAGEEA